MKLNSCLAYYLASMKSICMMPFILKKALETDEHCILRGIVTTCCLSIMDDSAK